MNNLVWVLDSTLREGEQTPGVYFDRHIKLAIAKMLDEIGINIIETGHPAVTEEIYDAVNTIAHQGLKTHVGAHARSNKRDVEMAIECGVDFVGIFYCVSDDRLSSVFKKELDDAIEQITQVIKYTKQMKPDVLIRYTPEDTVRSEFSNVIKAASAACAAGADIISVADTTGFMVPGTDRSMYDYIKRLKTELNNMGHFPKIAVHCHNDRGLALANALDAYRAGAEIIDASVLGLGERAGIVDLAQILTALTLDYGVNQWDLKKLPELYRFVSDHSGVPIPANLPIVGDHAFTHCAGVHTHAAAVNPMHYESLNPEVVGRTRTFALDHMSGIASLKYALQILELTDIPEDVQMEILKVVKSVGQKGKTVELSELKHIVDFYKNKRSYKA